MITRRSHDFPCQYPNTARWWLEEEAVNVKKSAQVTVSSEATSNFQKTIRKVRGSCCCRRRRFLSFCVRLHRSILHTGVGDEIVRIAASRLCFPAGSVVLQGSIKTGVYKTPESACPENLPRENKLILLPSGGGVGGCFRRGRGRRSKLKAGRTEAATPW